MLTEPRPGRLHVGEDRGVELEVPGVVVLARLQHRPRRPGRVAAALDRHRGEVRLVGLAVALVGGVGDHVVGAELGDDERAGADRAEVGLGALDGARAEAVAELRRLQDGGLRADEGRIGEGLGLGEDDADRAVVHRLHGLDAVEVGGRRAAALGVGAVAPGEHRVLGRDGRAVGPLEPLAQRPGDRGEVLRDAAVLDRGDALGEPGHELARVVEARQRLEHERGGLHLLGDAGEVGVQRRGRLPVEDPHLAVLAALGRGHRR